MPAAAPGNAKRSVGPRTARAIRPVFAPSAMRMPISRLRLVTKKDVTAKTPVAAIDSAMNAMTTNNAVWKLCFDQDNCALRVHRLDVEERQVRVGASHRLGKLWHQGERFAGCCAHEHHPVRIRELRVRREEVGLNGIFVERLIGHVADNANDLGTRLGTAECCRAIEPHTLSDRVLTWPESLRRCFVDDDDRRAAGTVSLFETAPTTDGHPQRLEVIR